MTNHISSLKNIFIEKRKVFLQLVLLIANKKLKVYHMKAHDQKLDFIVTEKEILSKVD